MRKIFNEVLYDKAIELKTYLNSELHAAREVNKRGRELELKR